MENYFQIFKSHFSIYEEKEKTAANKRFAQWPNKFWTNREKYETGNSTITSDDNSLLHQQKKG
jgi:hypothetical protein